MKIEFVNHASFIVSSGAVKLMCDPWLEGPAFHNGWALIAPTDFSYERFGEITHIWFSHEHPDHFSPPNLNKIPEADRKRITILFQKTKDKKVINYCRSIGFVNIRELSHQWESINPDFRLINRPHTDGDSWLCIETGGKRLLNVNDCNLESDIEVGNIARDVNGAIDILFTQFSYANAIGNRADTALRAQFAKAKTEEIKRQIRILKPTYVVPFASFVWFSHEENFFRNDAINTIDTAYDEIQKSGARPVVLFNGDTWRLEEHHDSIASIAKWQEYYRSSITENATRRAVCVEEKELVVNAALFSKRLKEKNSFLIRFWLQPTFIYVRDLNRSYVFGLNGLKASNTPPDFCDIHIGSEALQYCFKHEWGGSSTRINGRYEIPPFGKFERFKRYFLISQMNNQGESMGLTYAAEHGKASIRDKLLQKI